MRGSPNWGSVSSPSTSSLLRPASSSASRTASACKLHADLPGSLPNAVAPMPAIAVLPAIPVMRARVYAHLTRESVCRELLRGGRVVAPRGRRRRRGPRQHGAPLQELLAGDLASGIPLLEDA